MIRIEDSTENVFIYKTSYPKNTLKYSFDENEHITISAASGGAVYSSGHYSMFTDAAGRVFTSLQELRDFLDAVLYRLPSTGDGTPVNITGEVVKELLEQLPEGKKFNLEHTEGHTLLHPEDFQMVDDMVGLKGSVLDGKYFQGDGTEGVPFAPKDGSIGTKKLSPEITARLDLLREDVNQLLYPDPIIEDPQPIDDLSVLLVDSNAISLTWTSRSGDGEREDVAAHKYTLYYSNGAITEHNYKSARRIALPVVPELPGAIQKFTLSGLDADTVYHIAISAETKQVIERSSGISNVVATRTGSIVVPQGESAYIKVDPENVITYVRRYEKDPVTGKQLGPGNIVDGSVISVGGVPSADSDMGNRTSLSYTGWRSDWPQENPIRMVIDLRSLHRVDYLYIHKVKNTVFRISTSVVGSEWIDCGESPGTFMQWYRFDIPSIARECRYIRFEFPVPLDINEVAVYGSKLDTSLPKGVKHKTLFPQRTFRGFLGTNSFLNEDPADYGKFGNIIRYYNNMDWFTPLSVNSHSSVFSLDSSNGVPYEFATSRMWDFDQKMSELAALGIEPLWCAQGSVNWLLPQSQQGKFEYKPMDTHQIPSAVNSEDPMSYRFYAQFMFQVAARYGNNSSVDTAHLRLADGEPVRKGLGYLKYMEVWNEPDKTWEKTQGYFSPYELAAMMSACYDGHKGTLGEGFGIKAADPSMKVVMPALTEVNMDYVRFMIQWWDTNRGVGDYPMDILNFHIYSNTSGGNQVEATRKGSKPEDAVYMEMLRKSSDYRNRFLQHMEIWISETGYDEHPASNQAPPASIGDRVIGQIKADWLMRTFLVNLACGIDAVQQYMYRGAGNTLEQIASTGYSSVYLTSGYVDYRGTAGDRFREDDGSGNLVPVDPRLTSYFYISAMLKDLGDMYFSHVLKDDITDSSSILIEPDEDVFAVAFRSVTPGKPHCIAIWYGTAEDRTGTQTLRIDGSPTIQVSVFRDIEDTKSEQASRISLTPRADGTYGRVVDVPISETPVLVWTSDIGDLPIRKAINLKAIPVSTSSIRIVWEDRNTEDYRTEIYRSISPVEGFELVASDYMPECFYTDEGLESGTYHYMVRLVSTDLTRYSDLTDSVAVATMEPVQGVTSLGQGSAHVNRLSISWEFPSDKEGSISGFEVFKSSSPTGIYNRIATLGKSSRSYQDIGLTENTTYYYKVRSFSPLGYSEMSGVLAATTSEAQLMPPQLIEANTSFYGDRVFLFFNIPVKDVTGNIANFSVYEAGASVPLKTVSSINVGYNGQRVALTLGTPIESGTSVVTVGYDGLGTAASIFDVPMSAFEDRPVTNYRNSESLITNKMILSLNSFNTPEFSPVEGENFNELFFLGNGSQEQVVQPVLINTEGDSLPWTAIAPYVGNTYVMESSSANTPTVNSSDPQHPFILKQKRSGRMDSNYTASWNTVAVMGLDPTKRYNVKAFVTNNAADPNPRDAFGRVQLSESTQQTINARQNVEALFSWENLEPQAIALQAADTGTEIPNISAPKIIVQTKAAVRGQSVITCCYYIEEVSEVIPNL